MQSFFLAGGGGGVRGEVRREGRVVIPGTVIKSLWGRGRGRGRRIFIT